MKHGALTFQELWDESSKFRRLFLHNGIFRTINEIDLGKAEAMWWDRFPKLDWMLCGQDGCRRLVARGDRCLDHMPSGALPLWRWTQGILYKYKDSLSGKGETFRRRRQYVAYHRFLAEKEFGEIPMKCRVWYADGNPFNLRRDNLILVTTPMLAAIKAGVITEPTAVMLDDVIYDSFSKDATAGRPKNQWVYNMQSIAMGANVKEERVRQAVSRGDLEPGNLMSVSKFMVNEIPKGRRAKHWQYGIEEMSKVAMVSFKTVQRWIKKGALDPSSLRSIVSFCNHFDKLRDEEKC